jgi:hypothetical protein
MALLAALAGVVLAGVDPLSTLAGVSGVGLLAAGLARRSRPAVTVGAASLGAAVVLGGVAGAGGPAVVAATAVAVLAWTAGQTSVELADNGVAARTARFELTHVAGTSVLLAAVAGATLLPRVVRVRASPLGLALVLLGAVCLTGGLLAD